MFKKTSIVLLATLITASSFSPVYAASDSAKKEEQIVIKSEAARQNFIESLRVLSPEERAAYLEKAIKNTATAQKMLIDLEAQVDIAKARYKNHPDRIRFQYSPAVMVVAGLVSLHYATNVFGHFRQAHLLTIKEPKNYLRNSSGMLIGSLMVVGASYLARNYDTKEVELSFNEMGQLDDSIKRLRTTIEQEREFINILQSYNF